jgi:hypothetical protein
VQIATNFWQYGATLISKTTPVAEDLQNKNTNINGIE